MTKKQNLSHTDTIYVCKSLISQPSSKRKSILKFFPNHPKKSAFFSISSKKSINKRKQNEGNKNDKTRTNQPSKPRDRSN